MLILEDWRKEWERISFDASTFSVDSSSSRLDNGMYLFFVPPTRIYFKANARMHLHWPWLWLQWLLYHICYSSFSNANDDTIYHQDRWEQKVKLAANGRQLRLHSQWNAWMDGVMDEQQVSSNLCCCCGKPILARWSMYSHKRFAEPLTEAWDPRPLELNHFLGCLSAENRNCHNNPNDFGRDLMQLANHHQNPNANNRCFKTIYTWTISLTIFLILIFVFFHQTPHHHQQYPYVDTTIDQTQ